MISKEKLPTLDQVLGKNDTSEFEVLGSEEILKRLLVQFTKVDFKELVYEEEYIQLLQELESSDSNVRQKALSKISKLSLSHSHYYIHTVEEIIKVSTINDWSIVVNNSNVYVFNGAYWLLIDSKRFEIFLGDVALQIGVPKDIAKNYIFREKLIKQFWLDEFIPELQSSDSEVYINLQNGTLKIEDGKHKLIEFNKDHFLTYRLNYQFDRSSNYQLFQMFLDKVLPDPNLQMVLAEYIGYVFLPNNYNKFKAEKVLILLGTGANGKSVFNQIIKALIGQENITDFSLSSLTQESNGSYRARIENKLLNYSTELGRKSDADIFKKLASGEPVDARPLYKDPYIMNRYAKLIFNTNELPRDVEQKPSFFRRFLIIPFEVTIPEEEQDKGLAAKIIDSELTGILNWAIQGLERLLDQGNFTKSEISEKYLIEYQKDSDSVRLYLSEMNLVPDNESFMYLKTVFEGYKEFCSQDGYKPFSNISFSKKLKELGFKSERNSTGIKFYMKTVTAEKKFQDLSTSQHN